MEDKFLGDLIDWTDGTKVYVEDMISKAAAYDDIVIFGAGIGGKKTYEVLEQNNLLDRVRAFSDNNPEKTDTVYLGIRVIKPNCIGKQYPRALVLISSTAFDAIKKQLVGYGINEDNVYYFQPAGISMDGNHDMEFLRENIYKFNKVYQSLEDQKSKDIYSDLLNYRVSKNTKWLDEMKPLIDDEEGQYFDVEILKKYIDFSENGGFVDVGAYVGDTLENFYKRYAEFMGSYYCFEADDEIYSRLCKNIETKGYKNVIPLEYAAWNEKGELCFDTSSYGRGNGSRVSNIGTVVKCDSIDNLLGDKDVAFIKMDIEGAEKNALIGAENVIKKNKPILAVCIYHKQEDFFEIPLLIDSMVEDEYEFYVRQYRYGQSETVLYAMPKSRRRLAEVVDMQLQWKDATENIVPNTILEKVQKFSDVIVFGAGLSGDWAVNVLRKYGIYPRMYCDNYKPKWGTTRNQLRVDSFENAIIQYPKAAICIASMWGEEILKQIGEYDNYLLERTRDLLTSMNWETVGCEYKSSEIGYIKGNIGGFERLYNELGDEVSRKTLEGLLNYRLTRNKDFLKKIKSDESVYLDKTIVLKGKVRDGVQNRILIDGGAFDGDTIEQFVTELGDKTLHIVCYELEHKNCQKLIAMKDKYMNHNIEIHESALWSSDAVEMNFEGNGLSGTVTKSGTNVVKSETIDKTIGGRDVGFIKLDIEGAEREALKGAIKTIKRCRPLLAICAYHLQDDLLVLSDFIRSLDCGYEMKLRHYMCSAGDTIMYAIPKG